MNHRKYEDLFFVSQDPQSRRLDPEQLAELNLHLEGCQSCQQLVTAWREVDQAFERSPIVLPETGFTSRWQRRLEADSPADAGKAGAAGAGFLPWGGRPFIRFPVSAGLALGENARPGGLVLDIAYFFIPIHRWGHSNERWTYH